MSSKKIKLPMTGKVGTATIAVVCDPPSEMNWKNKVPMGGQASKLFATVAQECGFHRDDFIFISPCPPIPTELENSDKRTADFVMPYRETLLKQLEAIEPELIIYLGKWAGRVTMGRAVQIMKARGAFTSVDIGGYKTPVLPLLSPNHVLRRPENHDIFKTDFYMVERLAELDWDVNALIASSTGDKNYFWCTDLSFLLKDKPRNLAVDTETTGLKWYTCGTNRKDAVKTLVVQLCYAEGQVAVCPVDCDYYPDLTPKKRARLLEQLKKLLEDPKIRKTGHNLKYDTHILREDLGIYVENWVCDTQLLAFVVDENMQEKSLDECVRRWVPAMAGYNDVLNKEIDKENMRECPHDKMLQYSGGDADASFRLAGVLMKLAKKDKKQWKTFAKIIFPAIQAFCDPVEFYGVKVDTKVLSELQHELAATEKDLYDNLIAQVPASIKRKHADKGLKLTRDAFTRDILFTKQGLNLKPRVWTKSTQNLPMEERVPSVSTKQHLPYFLDEPFVAELTEYIKLQKLRSTYVGVPYDEEKGGPTGFWQYIEHGEIHPSFMLHRVVTGRTSSVAPNGQNFPKRGKLAKAYRKIFVARPGYVLIETDLSQAELRIAAWEANEKTMLDIYRKGGDIHAMTAAHTMGKTLKQFMAMDEEEIEQKRFQAKAVNFGFLYGMWWKKFKAYAKTDYGLEFTDNEAQELREAFFDLYPALEAWHEEKREFVREHGYVRALHGAVRHLPSINSAEDYIKQECERQAINSTVQRFASDLGLMAMIRLTRDADPDIIRPVLFVHDALVNEVKEEHAEEMRSAVKFYMESPPLEKWFGLTPPLPIVADIAQGYNLGEVDKFKDTQAIAPSWFQGHLD